jgi:protein-L-isoaspartate(D-aspartate) O-methyltransferase
VAELDSAGVEISLRLCGRPATSARERLERLGYSNVHVTCGDGSLGLAEHAPYDVIAVAAGGPKITRELLSQLELGGRLVIRVGPDESSQVLVRVTRESETEFRQEQIAGASSRSSVKRDGPSHHE